MRKISDFKLLLFFTALTVLLTIVVVFAWEEILRPPFFHWVETRYPGESNREFRWNMQQRVEHFFISITVDVVVVTLLLRVVRRQQRKIGESEERYRALFEHANDGIGVVRAADLRLVEFNGKFCEILGCSSDRLARRDIRDFLGSSAMVPDAGRDLLRVAEVGEGELMMRNDAGAPLPVAVSFSTLTADQERLIILIIRDLSARKRLEEEKEEIERQLYQSSKLASIGELSAGVAHEINNPLNGIVNLAQLLKDDGGGRPDSERQMLDGIIDEGGRIAQIVRGLLSFARHDEHDVRHVHLAETINTSIALFGRQLEKDGVKVELHLEPKLPAVRADGSRLRQVVVNMISNAHHALKAKRFAEHERRVFRVTARRGGGNAAGETTVLIEFYDNGVGIRRGDLPRVFDPFFTSRRDHGGTGLGLSISFGIIRDHGGTIRVESEEGSYTRFVVELPSVEAWESEYA